MGPRDSFYPYLYHCDYIGLLGPGFMQVWYLGRAPRTKETLPDFLKWRRVTRHPLVFRRLTGSQRTPGFGASQGDFYHITCLSQAVIRYSTLHVSKNVKFRLFQNSTKFDVVARFL